MFTPQIDHAPNQSAPGGIRPHDLVEEVSSWLGREPHEVDKLVTEDDRGRIRAAVLDMNRRAAVADAAAFYAQQFLLARIYQVYTAIPDGISAEGSVALHEVTRLLEQATEDAQDAQIPPGLLAGRRPSRAPTCPGSSSRPAVTGSTSTRTTAPSSAITPRPTT